MRSRASAGSSNGTRLASGSSTFVRTTDVADSGVTATVRTCSSGVFDTSWIESTAPSDETQSRGRMRSVAAWRAYSIDEIGAMSSSSAISCRFSAVGTPCTSCASASRRKKTGAMFTYEMRPSLTMRARSAHSFQDGGHDRLELLALGTVECGSRALRVLDRELARAFERSRLRDANERSALRPAAERTVDGLVLLRGQDQRQRRRAVAQVGTGDLAGLDRLAGAVEDVVHDLEDDPEVRAELAQRLAAAEDACRLEELRGLERTAFEVRLDARVGVVALAPLDRLAAHHAECRVGEDLDGAQVTRRRQLGERPREEVVAGRAGDVHSMRRPHRGVTAAHFRAIDQVVVHERRHVQQLDGDARGERRIAVLRRAQEDED